MNKQGGILIWRARCTRNKNRYKTVVSVRCIYRPKVRIMTRNYCNYRSSIESISQPLSVCVWVFMDLYIHLYIFLSFYLC